MDKREITLGLNKNSKIRLKKCEKEAAILMIVMILMMIQSTT